MALQHLIAEDFYVVFFFSWRKMSVLKAKKKNPTEVQEENVHQVTSPDRSTGKRFIKFTAAVLIVVSNPSHAPHF